MAELRDNQVPLGELGFAGGMQGIPVPGAGAVGALHSDHCLLPAEIGVGEGQSEISEIIQAVLTRNLQQRDIPFVLHGWEAANQHSNRDSLLSTKKE